MLSKTTNYIALWAVSVTSASAIVVDLDLTNTLQISSIVVEGVNYTSTTAPANKSNTRANLERILFSNGDQIDTSTFNNTIASTTSTYSPTALNADLGVFTGDGGGTRINYNPSNGTGTAGSNAAFLDEVQASVESKNLRRYFDFNGVGAGESVELTFNYTSVIDPNSSIILGERDGNSAFSVSALNSSGVVVGDTINITSNSVAFAFDTGFAASADTQVDAQSIELAVFQVSLFNTAEAIQSLRFFNASGADIFVLTTSAPVPEPTTFGLLLGLFAACRLTARKRHTTI